MIVVDASVVASVLLGDDQSGVILDRLLVAGELYAPELLDVEVLHVIRRATARHDVSARHAEQAVKLLGELPVTRIGHDALRVRIWQLRENLSAYDATCVALAEGIGATLVTRDRRFGGAPGLRIPVEVV
jgi:predicted nucleic acid-binding protein